MTKAVLAELSFQWQVQTDAPLTLIFLRISSRLYSASLAQPDELD